MANKLAKYVEFKVFCTFVGLLCCVVWMLCLVRLCLIVASGLLKLGSRNTAVKAPSRVLRPRHWH